MDAAAGIDIGTLAAVEGDLLARAGGSMHLGAAAVGGTAELHAHDMQFGDVRAGTSLRIDAQADVGIDRLEAGTDLSVMAGGRFGGNANSLATAGRDLRIGVGSIEAGTVQAGQDGQLVAAGDLVLDAASAGRDLSLQAGGTLRAASLRAAHALRMDAASVDVGALWTSSIAASTPGVLRIQDLVLEKSASLAAPVVDVGVRQARDGGLVLVVEGYKGGVASQVDLRVDAPAGLVLPSLRAHTANITSTAHDNRIDRGYVTGTLRLTSPDAVLRMNNNSAATVPDVTLQLYTPGYAFMLGQQGRQFLTDAYVTRYGASLRPTVPNYRESHLTSDVLVSGASAERDLEREAGMGMAQARNAPLARPVVALQAAALPPGIADSSDVPVNLGQHESSALEDGIFIDTIFEEN